MTNVKLSLAALAALTLAVSACAPNTAVPPIPSASPSAGATATPAPGTATPAPGESTTPVGSPAPGASATNNAGDPVVAKPVVVSGMVYDEAGATVTGATVTIKSLNAAAAYTATANTESGSWVVNNVPEGVNVEVVVTKPGWTTRTRVGSFQAASTALNTVNFGASGASAEPSAAYFISNYPEIMSTEPATKATGIEPGMITYKMRLSEALDETNRKRFEDAVRLLPANAEANPGGAAPTDYEDVADGTAASEVGFPYSVKKGTVFLQDTTTAATMTWSADGLEVTMSFKAPLSANKSAEAKYQVGLVRTAGSQKIEDKEGKQLGTDQAASLSSYPTVTGDLIRNTFKEVDLAIDNTANTASLRWAASHDSIAVFKVKRDSVKPTLTAVEVNEIGSDTRIQLTFSEAMAAFDGSTTGFSNSALKNIANYTFSVDETAADLDNELDGKSPVSVNLAGVTTYGAASNDRNKEFVFTGTLNTDYTIAVDPRDAKRVWITIPQANFFVSDLGAIKVRVEDVADPAGNAITSSDADKNVVTGSL